LNADNSWTWLTIVNEATRLVRARPEPPFQHIVVDEIQDLHPGTLAALLPTQHQAAQEAWPFFLFGAGLPSVPAVLAETRSYAERQFEYHSIGRLDTDESAEALTGPALLVGASYDDDALAVLVEATGGYPYFVQEYGAQTWRAAAGPDTITAEDAELGAGAGLEALDHGFFLARWERATKAEQRFMTAMADDDGAPSALPELVTRLGRNKQSDLSVARRDLIAKGLVYAPARGELAFTVPHMAGYIRRRTEGL
jgi:hypothetical protein